MYLERRSSSVSIIFVIICFLVVLSDILCLMFTRMRIVVYDF